MGAGLVAVLLVWWVMGWLAGQPPLPARPETDPFTGYVSGVADVVARLSGTAALGFMFAIVAFTPMARHQRTGERAERLRRWTGRAAQLWLWSSLILTGANATYVNGVPLAYALTPGTWWDFITTTPAGLAWLVSAVVALATVIVSYTSRAWAAYALAWIVGTLAWTFVSVTGNVTVGLHHDWATDAAIFVAVAWSVVASAAVAVVARGNDVAAPDNTATAINRARRYQRLAAIPLVVLIPSHLLIAWQQLAGYPPTGSAYGLASIGFLVVLGLLVVSWVIRRVSGEVDPARTTPGRAARSVLRDVVLVVAYVALRSAANHLPPPRFLIPQSIQVNYLGYEVNVPATMANLAGLGRPNLLWVGLFVAAAAFYLWGLLRIRAKGDTWPWLRTMFWFLGWGLMLYLAVAGLWEYSTVVFSWHMLVHMTVNMLVPVLCILGAPVSLLQAASRPRPRGQVPGPREASIAINDYRPLRRVFNPFTTWVLYVSSLFLVYLTPLFPWLMRYHWAHQLMLLYFMITGYLFFDLVIGVDRIWNLPHIGRLAFVIGVMPFHAIFAVAILSSNSLIGGDFYRSIDVSWIPDLMADQSIAGQITWIVGEVPLLIVILALAIQWFQQDTRDAKRLDRAQESGLDDSFDAYNDMLKELARRDRQAGSGASGGSSTRNP